MAEDPKDRSCVTIKPAYAVLYPSLEAGRPYPVNTMHPKRGEGFWLERTPEPAMWVPVSRAHVMEVPSFADGFDECAKAAEALAEAPKRPPRRERRKRLRGK